MISKFYNLFYNKIFPSKQSKRIAPWIKKDGDKTLRLDYPELTESSVVFDLGGFEGQWASDIYSKYLSSIFIFEPYKLYADKISNRFKKNPKIIVFQYGLGKENLRLRLNVQGDSSSTFKNKEDTSVEIEIKPANEFFQGNEIMYVDLMKINIEGGEYDLLEHLIETGLINIIKNIQVQFHDFVPNAEDRMAKIQYELRKTHIATYKYEFVWENWQLKK